MDLKAYDLRYVSRYKNKGIKNFNYSEDYFTEVKSLIKQFFDISEEHARLNSVEGNYSTLTMAINDGQKGEPMTDRFICDVYNRALGVNNKKRIYLMELLTIFLQDFIANNYKDETIKTEPLKSPQIQLSNYGLLVEARSNKVDELLKENQMMFAKRNFVNGLLKRYYNLVRPLSLKDLELAISHDDFVKVMEILEFFNSISSYYQNHRLNLAYLCTNDPLNVKYWYTEHIQRLFQNENSGEWENLKKNLFELGKLIPKIDNLSHRNVDTPLEITGSSLIDTSVSEVYLELESLNRYLNFSYDVPDTYYKMKDHAPHLNYLLQHIRSQGLEENKDSYFLRQKLADYYYMTNQREIGRRLWEENEKILPTIFDKNSKEFKEEYRLFLHSATTWTTFNSNEVSYCKNEWGVNSIQSFEAFVCRACLLIKYKKFDEAKDVLLICETILASRTMDISQINNRNSHLDFNYGKIFYFEARHYFDDRSRMSDLLDVAIGYFNKAMKNYKGALQTNIHIYYINYYLFECYRLLGIESEMVKNFKDYSSFFKHHPVASMCHLDKDELNDSLIKGKNL